MKIEINVNKMMCFVPENDIDYFWIGVISSKNTGVTLQWENGKIIEMGMLSKDVVIALGCNRN